MIFGDGLVGGKMVLDVGFSNVNLIFYCLGMILGVVVMENYGCVFGGNDKSDFLIYFYVYIELVLVV